MDRYDTDPQELAETVEMLGGLVEKPEQWSKPLDNWFKKNVLELVDGTSV